MQIVPTSDDEAGGLESCSALCQNALGCDSQVKVTALQTIIRSHETASSILGKRSASSLYELNRGCSRRAVVGIGAMPDSPSPGRSAQPPKQASSPIGALVTREAAALQFLSGFECRCAL
jgi:hypothetical protein